jgi:protein-tyrosine phosphatase
MGEFVLKDMVRKLGREDDFEIASRAVSREEIGNPVFPPARKEMKKHGVITAYDGLTLEA